MADIILYLALAVVVLAVIFTGSLINKKREYKKMLNRLRAQWGRIPEDDYKTGELQNIGGYYGNIKNNGSGEFYIDDITWKDLDMDRVFKRVNNTRSSAGEEYLYYLMRTPVFDKGVLSERERLIEFFRKNPAERERLQMLLNGLGKRRAAKIYDFFLDRGSDTYKYGRYVAHAVAMLLSPLCFIIHPALGLGAVVGVFLFNIFVYYKIKNENEFQLASLCYLVELFRCSRRIADAGIEGIREYNEKLRKLSGSIRSISINSFYQLFYQTNDIFLEPLKSMFHMEMIAYGRLLKVVGKYSEQIHELYRIVGLLDSAVSIASFRESVPYFTVPDLYGHNGSAKGSLYFKDACHPLIKDAVANSLDIVKPVLVTGSNASGKSTFLKTVAINAIFAQTIYTCLAREYHSNCFKVFTSMALRDDLASSTSYYIAEINSLKRILDNLNDRYPLLCMIDEVLRGTNTIERIAASSVILEHFSRSNCILIAATHDIELAEILKDLYENYHFTEVFEEEKIRFEYKIHKGKSTTHNAIKLLKIIGYPGQIVSNAESMAKSFLKKGSWI